jgi:hypothetical protein
MTTEEVTLVHLEEVDLLREEGEETKVVTREEAKEVIPEVHHLLDKLNPAK